MRMFRQIEKISLSSQAIKKLKERILTGQLPPGARLVAEDVAKGLGISRTPVRDALSKLVSEGLVTHNGNDYAVTSYSAKDIRELYPIRRILEVYAIRRAVTLLSEDQISRFRRSLERAEKRLSRTGEDENLIMIRLDAELHQLICDGANNERLKNILEDIREKTLMIHKWGYVTRKIEYIESARIEEFREFLSALESRDENMAVQLMEQHLLAAEDFTLECLGFSEKTGASSGTSSA